MTAIYIVCFILLVVGIIFALRLTPEQINKDISQLFTKKESLNGDEILRYSKTESQIAGKCRAEKGKKALYGASFLLYSHLRCGSRTGCQRSYGSGELFREIYS